MSDKKLNEEYKIEPKVIKQVGFFKKQLMKIGFIKNFADKKDNLNKLFEIL